MDTNTAVLNLVAVAERAQKAGILQLAEAEIVSQAVKVVAPLVEQAKKRMEENTQAPVEEKVEETTEEATEETTEATEEEAGDDQGQTGEAA